MALAKERGAYPIFRIHPIVYEFYCLYIVYILFIFYQYTLLKAVEKASITYSFTPNSSSP